MKKQPRASVKKTSRAGRNASKMTQGANAARMAPRPTPVLRRPAIDTVKTNGNGKRAAEEAFNIAPLFDLPTPIQKPIKQKATPVEVAPTAAQDEQPLEKIREILFGRQMSGVDERLAVIQGEMADLKKSVEALSAKLEESRVSSDQKLEHARRGLRMSITNAQMQLKEIAEKVENEMVDRATLADLLTQLGNSMKQDAHD